MSGGRRRATPSSREEEPRAAARRAEKGGGRRAAPSRRAETSRRAAPTSRRGEARKRRLLPKLIVLAVVVGVLGAGYWAFSFVKERLGPAPDYTGEGTGEIVIQVEEGSDWLSVANMLAEKDVVKSADAFYQEALDDQAKSTLKVGAYQMRLKMSAEAAYRALTTEIVPADVTVTVPEGARVGQVVEAITAVTDIPEDDLLAALDDPTTIGLPEVANGNAEGYLFPATYTVDTGETAVSLLSKMVSKTAEVTASLDIEGRAAALGYTTEEILTVASILEYEAKLDEDYPKVARVLYNRLDIDMPLQLDSTVSYVSEREGDVWTTPEERANPSEYNTYQHTGLPPGPIGSPGEKTIEAALNPADGDWLYFVAVDMETGETKYATTYEEHERNAEEAREYCRDSDIC
ncbi:MAG: endolytic transglycosylase MltG [Aeromicrobium sp.]|uniref:endolytic transglycosylase MltG n=1 Tax=Aeromicrobium sp. TaxID=1871063 RepID=UPI0039E6E79D